MDRRARLRPGSRAASGRAAQLAGPRRSWSSELALGGRGATATRGRAGGFGAAWRGGRDSEFLLLGRGGGSNRSRRRCGSRGWSRLLSLGRLCLCVGGGASVIRHLIGGPRRHPHHRCGRPEVMDALDGGVHRPFVRVPESRPGSAAGITPDATQTVAAAPPPRHSAANFPAPPRPASLASAPVPAAPAPREPPDTLIACVAPSFDPSAERPLAMLAAASRIR